MKRIIAAHPYNGSPAAIATQHGKERVIGPALVQATGLRPISPALNTDLFGTFTGEVERTGTATETAESKARAGAAAAGTALAVASEGSFGPHPAALGLPAGVEAMVFVDLERGIVLAEQRLSDRTNFDSITVTEPDGLGPFLEKAGFPSHEMIVRPAGTGPGPVHKGVGSRSALDQAVCDCAAQSEEGTAVVETDMRADRNPTRMAEIGKLAVTMAERLGRLCPECGTPGWGTVELVAGLPCEACGTATRAIRAEVLGCASCDHRARRPRPGAGQTTDPGSCPACNP